MQIADMHQSVEQLQLSSGISKEVQESINDKLTRLAQIVGRMQNINETLSRENSEYKSELAQRSGSASADMQESYNSLLLSKYEVMRLLDEKEQQLATLQQQFNSLSAIALQLAETAMRRQ